MKKRILYGQRKVLAVILVVMVTVAMLPISFLMNTEQAYAASGKITEGELFSKQYNKYLLVTKSKNPTYWKIEKKLNADIGNCANTSSKSTGIFGLHITSSDFWKAFSTITRMKDADRVNMASELLFGGSKYEEDIEEEMAIDFLRSLSSNKNYISDVKNRMADFDKVADVLEKFLKNGEKADEAKKIYEAATEDFLAPTLSDVMHAEVEIKKSDWGEMLNEVGFAKDSAEAAVKVWEIQAFNMYTIKTLMDKIGKDTPLYKGLEIVYEKNQGDELATVLAEWIDDDLIAFFVKKGVSTLSGGTSSMANWCWKIVGYGIKKINGDVDATDVIKANVAYSNFMQMSFATQQAWIELSNDINSDTINDLKFFKECEFAALNKAANAAKKVGKKNYRNNLKADYKKYKKYLNLSKYLRVCRENAYKDGVAQNKTDDKGSSATNQNIVVGDIVYFGSYLKSDASDDKDWSTNLTYHSYSSKNTKELKDTYENGVEYVKYYNDSRYFVREPISWRIIKTEGDNLLLISDQILDYQNFGEFWNESSFRTWLNKDFLNTAFSKKEQREMKKITTSTPYLSYNDENALTKTTKDGDQSTWPKAVTSDYVTLLNEEEAVSYLSALPSSKKESPYIAYETQYADMKYYMARNNMIDKTYEYAGYWWLRSPASWYYGNLKNTMVTDDGMAVNSYGTGGVRPVIKVNRSAVSTSGKGIDYRFYTISYYGIHFFNMFDKKGYWDRYSTCPDTIFYMRNGTYGKMSAPPKWDGHKFLGWYTKKKGGKKITAETKIIEPKNIIVYAHWKRK